MIYNEMRPNRFVEVLGQPVAIALKNSVALNKIRHAHLIFGPRGTGKTTLARIYGKAINCKNQKGGEPCLSCEACKDPEIWEIDSGSATNETLDRVRQYLATVSRYNYKTVIFDEAHALSANKQTFLLKLLEEPPSNAIIFLLTTEYNKLDEALVSRCLRWQVKYIPFKTIMNLLRRASKRFKIPIDKEVAKLVALESEGSPRSALSLLESLSTYKDLDVPTVLSVLSIADVGNLVKALTEENLVDALHECESLSATYESKTILVQAAKEMMRLAIEKMQEGDERGRKWAAMSERIYRSRDTKVVNDLAHLQTTMVYVLAPEMEIFVPDEKALNAMAVMKPPLDCSKWEQFLATIEVGVAAGFYTRQVESDVLFLSVEGIDLENKTVYYKHELGGVVSEDVKLALNDFLDETYEWSQDDYDRSTGTKSGGKNTSKRRKSKNRNRTSTKRKVSSRAKR